MLTLKLFGAPGIERSGGLVTGRAAQGRRLALLAYLTLPRSRLVTRDKVIAMLWPESPADRARQRLSDDVYIIRSALGEDVVHTRGDELALNIDRVTSDVGDFEQLLDAGQPEAALRLVVGPLLDGFHLAESPEFEQWLGAQRSRLAQRQAAALESLAERSESRADHAAAVGWWQSLAALDAGNGRITLRLMRALDAAGDRAGALRHARFHATLMREEFDAEPDPQVSRYAEQLRLEPPSRSPIATDPAPSSTPETSKETSPVSMPVPPPAAPPSASAPSSSRSWYATPLLRGALAAGLMFAVAALKFRTFDGASAANAADTAAETAETAETGETDAAPPVRSSVAVLPFVNMGTDPENQYFGDGLAEQVITALSGIDGLQVAARTSSFALRDRTLDIRTIGRRLGVAAVLEGSIRREANRLRITAQLIDASTGYHVWSHAYDRELQDIFTVQDEIASAIAGALQMRLVSSGTPVYHTPDPAVYALYLRALHLRNSLAPLALRQAEDLLDSVIAREPRFALAYAAQASIIAPQILFGVTASTPGTQKLRTLNASALALDSTLGEAHATLGVQQLFFDWDWSGAERSLRRAIALNPNDAHAHHHLANYLNVMGRVPEAITARLRAAELDPLNARTAYTLASDYLSSGDTERAMARYRAAIELDPAHTFMLGKGPFLPQGPAEVYLAENRFDLAVDEYVRVATLRGATSGEIAALRRGYGDAGMQGFWRSWIDMDVRQSAGAPDALRMAKLWTLAGDTAQALAWLERAYANRHPALIYLDSDDTLRQLRGLPQVAQMRAAMKLP